MRAAIECATTSYCTLCKAKTKNVNSEVHPALLLCICMENVLERGWSSQLLCTALMSEDDCEACLLIITWRGRL